MSGEVKGGSRGLTLGELVVSLGLLTLMMLGLIRLFTVLLSSSTKNSRNLVGTHFAAQKLEEVIASAAFNNSTGNLEAYTVDASTRTQFYFRVQSEPLSASLADPDAIYLGGFLVTVQVWWNSQTPEQARPGVGLQTAQVSRFYYPRIQVNGP